MKAREKKFDLNKRSKKENLSHSVSPSPSKILEKAQSFKSYRQRERLRKKINSRGVDTKKNLYTIT